MLIRNLIARGAGMLTFALSNQENFLLTFYAIAEREM
jgi:hypothetical protein